MWSEVTSNILFNSYKSDCTVTGIQFVKAKNASIKKGFSTNEYARRSSGFHIRTYTKQRSVCEQGH